MLMEVAVLNAIDELPFLAIVIMMRSPVAPVDVSKVEISDEANMTVFVFDDFFN